jgi:hypothetical protein
LVDDDAFGLADDVAVLLELAELDAVELVLFSLLVQAPSEVLRHIAVTTANTGRCARRIVTPSGRVADVGNARGGEVMGVGLESR